MPLAARSAVAVVLCGLTALAAGRLHALRERPYDVTVIPPARVVRIASLGHPTLAGNLYWLRAVQYVGDPRANERGWEHLYPLLDLVTDLDPGHGYAYQVGGVILGTARRVAESNALLEKGIRALPTRYILPLLRAFNAFYYQDDYTAAGRFAEIAARTPGAPRHVSAEALAFLVKGNRAELAVAFLEQMVAEATDPETRAALQRELKQARLERDAQVLDSALERYRERYGLTPFTLQLLVVEGLVARIPPDPFGGVFVVGADGRAHSSVNAFRFSPAGHDRTSKEPGLDPGRGYPGVRLR